jgi:release factor glutamine methyltransferase
VNILQRLQSCSLPRLEARMLMERVLGKDGAWLIGHADEPLSADAERSFARVVARRQEGEPIAYIIGEREFYGLKFKVGPAVLIPRPETELLVDLALQRSLSGVPLRMLDLGTGSGAIAVTLAKQRPLAQVTAVDADEAALAFARDNAVRHSVTVKFLRADWFSAVAGETFDLIVSNPPYVAENDRHLMLGDVRFEPRGALSGGRDGLDCLRTIVAEARSHLNPDGWLLFEHGFDQAAASRALLQAQGFTETGTWPDLAGIARVSGGKA